MSVKQQSLSFGIVDQIQVFKTILTLICQDWKKKRLSSPCPTIAAPDNPQAIRLVCLQSCEKHRTFLKRFPLCSVSSNQTRSNAREELDHAQIVFEARHEITSVIIFTSLIAMFFFPSKWTSFKILTRMCLLFAICTYRWASSWQAILFIFSSKDAHAIRALLKT